MRGYNMAHSALKVSQSAYDWLKQHSNEPELINQLEAVPDENWINGRFECTTQGIAEFAGVNDSRIRQLAPMLEKEGLARKIGNVWKFKQDAARFVHDMPDGRGRQKSTGGNT